jgi:hypothetical protein
MEALFGKRLCRRSLIGLGVSIGVIGGLKMAAAQSLETIDPRPACSNVVPKKSSKEDAHHREVGYFDKKNCGNCRAFMSPDQCFLVEGTTSPNNVCTLWAKKDGRPIGCSEAKPAPI